MDQHVLAWLAGLWDGEGSIGISCTKGSRGLYLAIGVQLEMTCDRTVARVAEVCDAIGVTAKTYSYRERDPSKHLDSHYLRVNRLGDALCLARALVPYAVTKRQQWELMIEYVESRIGGRALDASGRVPRGGNKLPREFSPREIEIAATLRSLNARGPGGKKKAQEWLEKLRNLPQLPPPTTPGSPRS